MAHLPAPVVIHPWIIESIGPAWMDLAGGSLQVAMVQSIAWPSANLAIYIPFWLQEPITVVKLFCQNGTIVSGNVDVGLYDRAGTRIVSSGSTAQAGASAAQEFDIVDTLVGTGAFYLAIALDNTTGTLRRAALSATTDLLATFGLYQQETAFPLPATATFARMAQNYLPVVAATRRTLV